MNRLLFVTPIKALLNFFLMGLTMLHQVTENRNLFKFCYIQSTLMVLMPQFARTLFLNRITVEQ